MDYDETAPEDREARLKQLEEKRVSVLLRRLCNNKHPEILLLFEAV